MLKVMALSVAIVVLFAGVTIAQSTPAQLTPRRIEIDKMKCAELAATKDEARYRLLVYLNGYMNALRGQKVWDEQTEGERIDRAPSECKAAPTRAVLDVFTSFWPR